MKHPRAQLAVGKRVVWEGEIWQIVGLSDSAVLLNRAGSPGIRVLINRLVGSPGFRMADDRDGLPQAAGPAFEQMTRPEYEELIELECHVREVLTGYRRGDLALALPGEPRPEFLPLVPKMAKYASKAAELGVSPVTVRRMVGDYEEQGLFALVDGRSKQGVARAPRVDPRWVACVDKVLAEYSDETQTTKQFVIDQVRDLAKEMPTPGAEPVRIPSNKTALKYLNAKAKGRSMFEGKSGKNKRSIANRPGTPYGKMRSFRFGEYVLLDTTVLDVFGMDPITLSWVQLQLTVAMDLATRSIVGLRLSPVSANAVDAAVVLFETFHPNSTALTNIGLLPYGGLPQAVFSDWAADDGTGLPGGLADTIVVDHGKMYVSKHVGAVCQNMGISLQPVRKFRPTDKSVLERFFRTLRTGLLERLPGYKGPDVFSRGKDVEAGAWYFSTELEQMIREWIAESYHPRPHRGLHLPGLPGLKVSPNEMREHLTSMHGSLVVPRRLELVYDFLPVEWRQINHYGVELRGFRYDGKGLNGYRNTSSPFSRAGGKWPLRFDPDDVTRVYFQRPDDNSWHTLHWDQASKEEVPFSFELAAYVKTLLSQTDGNGNAGVYADKRPLVVQVQEALSNLLRRWGTGSYANRKEKRLALRAEEQRKARKKMASLDHDDLDGSSSPTGGVTGAVYVFPQPDAHGEVITGDDDLDSELDNHEISPDADDYYNDTFEVGL